MKKRSKAVFWLIILLALSALTIYIIVSSNDGFSFDKFLDCCLPFEISFRTFFDIIVAYKLVEFVLIVRKLCKSFII